MNNTAAKSRPVSAYMRVGGILEIPPILRSFDVNPDEVLIAAGINPILLENPDNLITYAARGLLIRRCIEKTSCQHFGLLIGRRMGLPSLGLPGLLARVMPDVGSALRTLQNSFSGHTTGAELLLRVDGDLATLSYETITPGVDALDQLGAGAIAGLFNVLHSLCGPDFQPLEASFAHGKPADIRPYRDLFRIPLYFNAPQYALIFSRKWLGARPPSADAELQRVLQEQLDAHETRRGKTFPEYVKALIRSTLTTGHCTQDEIAALLEMGPRTLIRRLESAGTSFHELLAESRYELAQRMLKNSSLSIGEISDALCYSRASSFDRAFRRWSGCTPVEWRASHDDKR